MKRHLDTPRVIKITPYSTVKMYFFRDVIGHDELKKSLIRSVQAGSIAHAQLFSGTEGVGKFAMAMAYARYIHCTNRGDNDACGECPSCQQYNALSHADLHFVFPIIERKHRCDNYLPQWSQFISSNAYFGINDWLRTLNAENKQAHIYSAESDSIWHKMTLKSFSSPYKIMIIWLPERMNIDCANKLLKLFEEPYPNSIFLLVSNAPDMLLSTIRSRVQQIVLPALPLDTISQALQEQYNITATDAHAVAHLSEGSYLKACNNLSLNEENKTFFDFYVQLMRLAYTRKVKELKAWSEDVADLGREQLRRFCSYASRMTRENYIYNVGHAQLNYMTTEEAQFSTRFAVFINERNVREIMQLFENAEKDIAQNANAKIVLFDIAIKMILLLKN